MIIPNDYAEAIAHLGLKKAASYTKCRFNFPETVEEIIKEWNDAAIYQYTNNVVLKPYAYEYLEYLNKNGVKLGIATANSSEYYMPCLKKNKIDHFLIIYVMFQDLREVKNLLIYIFLLLLS